MSEWIEIDPKENDAIPDEPVWVFTIDEEQVEFKDANEFIPYNSVSHYQLIEKPNPPNFTDSKPNRNEDILYKVASILVMIMLIIFLLLGISSCTGSKNSGVVMEKERTVDKCWCEYAYWGYDLRKYRFEDSCTYYKIGDSLLANPYKE